MEGDLVYSAGVIAYPNDFYPRPPGGGRRRGVGDKGNGVRISIHALRVEGDFVINDKIITVNKFLSTPSGWRATDRLAKVQKTFFISIHALRVEGDDLERLNKGLDAKISIHALRVEGDSVSKPL